jgi:hypothetical protein
MLSPARKRVNAIRRSLASPHPAANDSRIGIPKNKSEIRGIFSVRKKPPSTSHDSPQIHHQKTTFCHPFPPKPPAKRRKLPSKKITRPNSNQPGIALPNTNGSLILDQIQIIVEVGGLSNDEVYTNSHRGFALRVIFCHIRNFDRNCNIPQHQPGRENRAAPGDSVVPAGCCSGRSQSRMLGQLPGIAHLLPLFRFNQRCSVSLREGAKYLQQRLPTK